MKGAVSPAAKGAVFSVALAVTLVALPVPTRGALTPGHPGSEARLPRVGPGPGFRPPLQRIRVVLTTESPAADLILETGTIVNASVTESTRSTFVRRERNQLSLRRQPPADGGGSTDVEIHLLVSGIRRDAPVRWRLNLGPSASPSRIEVYNDNQQGRARLVDRFDADGQESTFDSPGDRLIEGGPAGIAAGPRPLVLAFLYPWYQHFSWSSDHLQDQSLLAYSNEVPDEVARSLEEARAAGLDGVIVSWRGDTDWNDRRLKIVLDKAQAIGLRVSILVETEWAADPGHVLAGDLNPDKMRYWLEKAVDVFAPHPAFLKTGGRPVVFVYIADSFPAETWRTMIQGIERGGRHLFLMADSLDPALLESFNGEFTYSTAAVSQADLGRFDDDQALRTETYDLLHGGGRRVAAATVIPGYDDSLLGRDTSLVRDRADGALYEAQWGAAVAAQPDWVIVTTWNEFYENTHIEPSVRYGHRYQERTRSWSEWFRNQSPNQSPVGKVARPQTH